ncbi:MAG: NADH:ubiquinone reductase (Na(+)-transporting) subunit C [Fulvivirga sp.]|nr:NADH:ubiquinone reductase (Na(+)-transporting) subunit C [Fulvivirga sp.]
MRQSNGYVILFTAILTIVVGGVLSFTSQVLAPAQKRSVELDTKSQILSSVMDRNKLSKMKPNEILSLYDDRISSLVVDINGEKIETNEDGEPIVAEEVDILKNYKKTPENRMFPVFKYMNAEDTTQVDAYILPVYGSGLWDKIWGFIALDRDLETIAGASFAHKAETPGLGARIATPTVQNRYVGKKIYNDQGELVSVKMVKGEGNAGLTEHQVDGMSGATITGKGLNAMLENYLSYYQAYFEKLKNRVTAKL